MSAPAAALDVATAPRSDDERAGRARPSPQGEGGLLSRLMSGVRAQFRVDTVLCVGEQFHPGRPGCRVGGCSAGGVSMDVALCRRHRTGWSAAGRPDLAQWADAEGGGARGLRACAVVGCGRGVNGAGLCRNDRRQWRRDGQPDRTSWLTTQTGRQPAATDRRCQVPSCELLAPAGAGGPVLCCGHRARMAAGPDTDLDAFLTRVAQWGSPRLSLGCLSGQLKLEVQYAVQCRVDERRLQTGTDLATAMPFLAAAGVSSLLELTVEQWVERVAALQSLNARAFVLYARAQLEALTTEPGWAGQYDRDVWDMHRLGKPIGPGHGRHLRFDRISQSWLRDLAKRLLRHRMNNETSPTVWRHDLAAVDLLSQTLAAQPAPPGGAHEITREHLERHRTHIRGLDRSAKAAIALISPIATLLEACRRFGWAALDPGAQIYRDDYPRGRELVPRNVPEHVMSQIESPQNMARWPHPADRLIAQLIISTGRRVGEACTLRTGCLRYDSASGAPYLRYVNAKMRREAYCPVTAELAADLQTQQAAVHARWGPGDRALFPKTQGNPDGLLSVTTGSFRYRLNTWLATCHIEDSPGVPAHVTPHAWRHTFAIRLVDCDVPLQVVARLLDHDSILMTQHYGRVSDTKTRREWERARKVNADGAVVRLDPAEELAEPAYLAHKLAQSRHALTNGYCRLASATPCEFVNPCFTCPLFVTTPSFLTQHRTHRAQVAKKLARNTAAGRSRAAEKNAQDLQRLDQIIDELTRADSTDSPVPAPPSTSHATAHPVEAATR